MDREFKIVFFIMLLAAVIGAARLPKIINSQAIVIDYTKTQQIEVTQGDSLWGIAKSLNIPDKDIRIIVEEIKILNNLPDYTIYPGQVLRVPDPNSKEIVAKSN